jgi:hypothetical protein
MKKPTAALLLAVSLIIGACGTTGSTGGQETASVSVPAEQTALFTGDGGNGISLAILSPEAEGLDDTQKYIPALVQGEFVSNFTSYSAISVLDREHLDEQYAEILSGYYDDNAEAGDDLGHLVPTEYIMGGSIIKTASGYALQMRVTKTSDKTTLCSYSGTCTFAELDNLTGVRRTSLDLLAKMGVQLTARAKDELSGAAAAYEVQGQTALAQGVTAQRSGTVVEALSYYFQAASYDASLTEAASRVNVLTANITSGNMGEDIRNDIQWRDQWRARLAEAEQVYADYVKQQPLYYLVYNADLKHGSTNYSNNTVPISGVTLDLVPDAMWFTLAGSVARMINVVRAGLLATGQADKWGLNWPRNTLGNSPFGDREQRFEVVVELVNSDGKTIGSERITVLGGYDVEWSEGALRRLAPRMRGIQNLEFRAVNAYDITTNLTVRIAGIDGVAAETAAKARGVTILREAEYARLPEVIDQLDSRSVARFAQDIEMNSSGEITAYKGAGGNLVIPPTIFGLPVTAIGKEAFTRTEARQGNRPDGSIYSYNIFVGRGLTGITIPNGIFRIGENAFSGNELGAIVIPNSMTDIEESAFRGAGITSATIPNTVIRIREYAFFGNDLTSVTIPDSVVRIGEEAFSRNDLTSITIPANLTLPKNIYLQQYGVFVDYSRMIYNNSFDTYYERQGKKAGTYTRPNIGSKKWTYRP